MNKNLKALAFIDLLGFSGMVERNFQEAKKVLNDFYEISFGIIKKVPEVKGKLFSDSLLAISEKPEKLVNTVCEIYRECLRKNDSYTSSEPEFFLLPRGGISFGVVEIENRNQVPNLTKDFIVSPALVHSTKMEKNIKGSRLLISDCKNDQSNIFLWNHDVKAILYEHSPFILWKGFMYYDALWFSDLSKDHTYRKEEVVQLLKIVITLINNNSKKDSEILEHYIQILRIGLLSYANLVDSPNDNIIKNIMHDFSSNKYWMIWLTLFEVLMQIKDSCAPPVNPAVVSFYRKVCLKKGWSKVINEINLRNNTYLRKLFIRFLNGRSINVLR